MKTIGERISGLAAALLVALAGSAAAQGYAVETVDEALLERPAGIDPLADVIGLGVSVPLPFRFAFYGDVYDSLFISIDGYVVPGANDVPRRPVPDLFPDGRDRAHGFIAPMWRQAGMWGGAEVWVHGRTPERRLVVTWRDRQTHFQVQLHERGGEITFAYEEPPPPAPLPRDAPESSDTGVPPIALRVSRFVRGLAECGGDREFVPEHDAIGNFRPPPDSLRFTPRAPLFHPDGIGRRPVPARWLDARKESTIPEGSTQRASYLAKSRHAFHVRDRALFRYAGGGSWRKQPPEVRERLLAEDRGTFGGDRGDARRWVRQVLDGKMIFLPAAPGAPPLRVWFRIVEFFSLDDRGNTLTDHHTWNLRWMLSNAFRDQKRKEPIDGYWAWKAMARGRLTVGKLLRTRETDDAGKQYSSGRKNEYLLWSGRLRRGTRGALAPFASPTDGWVKFYLREEDSHLTQHAEKGDLRFVPDPNYVDGHYEYTVEAPDNPYGWITGRTVPAPPIRDEGFDEDPGRTSGPITPR